MTRATGQPLRIGVLGASRIAERAIVAPARLTGHRLVAVAARDRDRAGIFADEHGVERVLGSYAELLADREVEAVYNPLANGLHGPWNRAAAEAGKHVLTEKPSASDAGEARETRDAVAAAGVRFLEGFHYPYHPLWLRLQELLASGELGELRAVEIRMIMPAPAETDPRWSLELAGGALMDVGCYGLHAHRMLGPAAGGSPEVVAARAGEHPEHPGVDEWLDAEFAFPGGATGSVRCGMNGPGFRFDCRLVGSRGTAYAPEYVRPDVDDRIVVTTPSGERTEELGKRSSYTYQLEAFAAHVRDGAPVVTDADDAVATMELIDTCYVAAGLTPRPRTPR